MRSLLTSTCSVENLARNLAHAASTLTQLAPRGEERLSGYLRWALDQERMLRADLRPAAVESLIYTRRHDLLVASVGAMTQPNVIGMLDAEIDRQTRAFGELSADLERWRARWARHSITDFIVPDTNILIEHKDRLDHLDWRALSSLAPDAVPCVVVPRIVIAELDALKAKGQRDAPTHARTALRTIETLFRPATTSTASGAPGPVPLPDLDRVFIDVLVEPLDHDRLPDNDSEIIAQAMSLKPFVPAGRTLAVVSGDTAFQFLARNNALTVHPLPEESRRPDPPAKRAQTPRRAAPQTSNPTEGPRPGGASARDESDS